mgnify:CR=1 FL=1
MSAQSNEKDREQDAEGLAQNNWLCVMCKTQQEFTAEDNLKRQGFTVYLPTAPNRSRKQVRVTTDIKAMFPGYLFIEADPQRQDLSVIRSTLGCIAFLRHGARPALVPNQVMESIKQTEDVLHGKFEIHQNFTPGSKYELMEQGFNGHTATFLALDGKERARVLVTLLNKEHEVKIPTSSLGQQV